MTNKRGVRSERFVLYSELKLVMCLALVPHAQVCSVLVQYKGLLFLYLAIRPNASSDRGRS